ncbi:MAG: DUF4340 domain-containing protein [Chloroflexi bacterium]|nr:MAG: DUF4340 domain-containing protein [Chloroflexota bacterium]
MKKQGGLLVLVILFISMAILLVIQDTTPETPTAPPTLPPGDVSESIRLFPGIEVDDVRWLEIIDTRYESPLRIEREDTQWLITLPDGNTQNDANAAANYINSIISLQWTSRLSNIEDYSVYGLADEQPTIQVHFETQDGQQHQLLLGDMTNDGSAFYARVDEQSVVYLLAAPTDDTSSPGLAARIFPTITPEQVMAVRLTDPQENISMTIVQQDDGTWGLADSPQTLDQDIMLALIRAAIEMRYRKSIPLDETETLSTYGLDEERVLMVVTLLLDDGSGHNIAIGDITPMRDAFYALVDEQDEVFLIDRAPDPVSFLLHYFEEYKINAR